MQQLTSNQGIGGSTEGGDAAIENSPKAIATLNPIFKQFWTTTAIVAASLFCSIASLSQNSINVDIQRNSSDRYTGPNAAGRNVVWNHIENDNNSGLLDASGNATSASLILSGANSRWDSDWSTHDLLEDFLYRDGDAWAVAEINGLNASLTFDLFIYTGVEGGRYRVAGNQLDATNNANGPDTDPVIAAGAPFTEGKNYVVFRNIKPSAGGQVRIEYQDSPLSAPINGNFSGFTLEEKSSVSLPTNPALGSSFSIGDLVVKTDAGGQISEAKISGLNGAASFTLLRLEGAPPKATGGELDFLGFKFPITTAEVDPIKQIVTVTAQIGLPYPLFTDNNNQPIRQRVVLQIDRSGNVSIVGGQIFIPQLKAGRGLELANLNLQFDVRTGLVSGGVDVKVGKQVADPCNILGGQTNPFVGGFIEFRHGQLNSLSVTGSNLRKPIGAAYLDLIQASVFDLAAPNGNWSVQGRMVINGGCPFNVAGVSNVYPITVDANGTYYADRRFSLNGQGKLFNIPVVNAGLTVGSSETVVKTGVSFGNVFNTQTSLTIRPGQLFGTSFGDLKIPSNTQGGIGGMSFPEVSASLDNNGIRGSFSVLLTASVPRKCIGGGTKKVGYNGNQICIPFVGCHTPRLCCINVKIPEVCSPAIPEIRPSFGFEYNWNSGQFGFSKKNALNRDPWDRGLRPQIHDPETNGTLTFLTNWDRLDRVSTGRFGRKFAANGGGSPVCTINVPEGHPGVFFRLSYSNLDSPKTGLKVTLPNGTELDSDSGALPFGFNNALGYSRANPDAQEIVVLLINPAAGDYEVTVENAEVLKNFSVDAVAQNRLPYAGIIQLDGPNDDGIIDLYWAAEDISGPATVTAYLEQDTKGNSGIAVSESVIDKSTPDDEIELMSIDLSNVDAQPGVYYVMLKIDDGINAPDYSYSEIQIEFEHPDAPAPVPAIATAPGYQSIEIAWEPSESSTVDYYQIVYSRDTDTAAEDQILTVSPQTTEATIPNLINGQPYLVSIIAGTADGIESAPSEYHRVIPTAGPGLDLPIITSSPDTDATSGYLYTYFAIGFDADAQNPITMIPEQFTETAETVEAEEPTLFWSLGSSPDGMTIHPSGLLTWTPTESQIGDNAVTLRLSKKPLFSFEDNSNQLLVAEQTFTINVLDPQNLNGLEPHPYLFISTPPLFTTENATYRYSPEALTPDSDWAIQLINGPEGMEVTENNEVIWEVPTDSPGEFIWIRAITSTGDEFDQFYYLHVDLDWNQLPEAIRIATARRGLNGEIFLNWVGTAEAFEVQRKVSLSDSDWTTISGPITPSQLNVYIDTDLKANTAFYRIVEWEDLTP